MIVLLPEIPEISFGTLLPCDVNPKAIAAQTFKSDHSFHAYAQDVRRAYIAAILKSLLLIDNEQALPGVPLPVGEKEPWVMFPWMLSGDAAKPFCVVWRGQEVPHWHRHCRVYRSEREATLDNEAIKFILADY